MLGLFNEFTAPAACTKLACLRVSIAPQINPLTVDHTTLVNRLYFVISSCLKWASTFYQGVWLSSYFKTINWYCNSCHHFLPNATIRSFSHAARITYETPAWSDSTPDTNRNSPAHIIFKGIIPWRWFLIWGFAAKWKADHHCFATQMPS